MSVALNGNLQDFGIADVFQLIGQQRKTGFLELERSGDRLRIGFAAGAVVAGFPVGEVEFSTLGEQFVRAGLLSPEELDRTLEQSRISACPLPDLWLQKGLVTRELLQEMSDLLLQESLFRVMAWSEGSFHFSTRAVRNEFECQNPIGVEQVLMNGLRMLDEWRMFDSRVRSGDTVFRIVQSSDGSEPVESSAESPDEDRLLAVLRWIDGSRCVEQIIHGSRLGTFETSRILSELQRARRIESVVRTQAPTRVEGRPDWRSGLGSVLRMGLASVLPLLFLAVVVAMGLLQRPLDSPLTGHPVVKRPLAEAWSRFERRRTEQLRLSERYRVGELTPGGWEVIPDDFRIRGPLASGTGSAYHGLMHQDSVVPGATRR